MKLNAPASGWRHGWLDIRLKAWAIACLLAGQRRRALDVFGQLQAAGCMDVYTLASRAQLLHQLGDTTGAIEVQQALMDHHPGFAAGRFNLGFMLQQAQRDAEAVSAFREAVALQPKLDRAWYGLGLSLIRLGRLEGEGGAAAALEQNTALQPFSPHGWYQLARVRAELGQMAQAEAIALKLQAFEPRVAAQLRLELRRGPGQGVMAATSMNCDGPAAGNMASTKAAVCN